MNTKERIAQQAIESFNEMSYAGVNLFELAQKLGISRGNLTYHFKDKEALLRYIFDKMWEKFEVERQKAHQFPSFENLHNEVQLYYKFQKAYSFIFLDNQVLRIPFINQKIKELSLQSIADNNAALAFACQLGNMRPEPAAGIYNNLSITVWIIAFFWSAQQVVRGEIDGEDGEKMIWSLLIPHFTEKGVQSFIGFFGKDYYNSLGKPFNSNIESFISF